MSKKNTFSLYVAKASISAFDNVPTEKAALADLVISAEKHPAWQKDAP
jgi:hypothetical protein